MKLAKTSEYAIRILTYMASDKDKMFNAKEIIEELKVSDKYLRKLMTKLSKAGFTKSIQGRNGGYIFNKPINEIFLIDIIDTVEGLDTYMGCVLGFDRCSNENPCVMHNKWKNIREEFFNVFKSTSLAEFSTDKNQKF